MILRLLIGSGLLLMAVGFGAAGWQYWQSLPPAAALPQPEAGPAALPERTDWLLARDGALVPQDEVRAYLTQDRFVPGRFVSATLSVRLEELLSEGEKLPEAEYLAVLADIRAPLSGVALCKVLLDTIASACETHSARAVAGSLDEAAGTATLQLDLAYRLISEADDLPDLATHVLAADTVGVDPAPGEAGASSAAALLESVLGAAETACLAEGVGQACRITSVKLAWLPGRPATAEARVGWLEPLPDGMLAAPPLEPAAGG